MRWVSPLPNSFENRVGLQYNRSEIDNEDVEWEEQDVLDVKTKEQ